MIHRRHGRGHAEVTALLISFRDWYRPMRTPHPTPPSAVTADRADRESLDAPTDPTMAETPPPPASPATTPDMPGDDTTPPAARTGE